MIKNIKRLVILCIWGAVIGGLFVRELKAQKEENLSFLLLISEQNIEGPQRAWWASEVDLSTVEAKIAQVLIENNYKVIEPQELRDTISKEKAFSLVNISEESAIGLAKLKEVDYIILGKAIASAGDRIPASRMRACFANITVKLIRVKDKKIISYLDSTASSPHTDLITGGKLALSKAAQDLGLKIINALEEVENE